ncbi:helix-turn-helix transcriptional regulator [Streptomyces xiamenensis]|uniref:helix-turn-helix domain-containing protein n=1 Tax=Streptomyces xiamenensis TaxID=408015 RepID=UPI0034437DA7
MENTPEENARATPAASLSRRLSRARERAGLSLRELAAEIRFPHSYIHRIEKGKQLPSDDLAEALDRFFQEDGLFVELLEMARTASLPGYGDDFLLKEPTATRMEVVTSTVVPGLFQTQDYARALIAGGHSWKTERQIEDWVAVRLRRQRILHRETPPYISAIMDEAALKRPIGGRECMVSQLGRMLELVESLYVSVQVLPFSCEVHPVPGGSVTLLTMPDGASVGYVEGVMVGETIERPERVLDVKRKLDVARSLALPDRESMDLIRKYVKEHRDG